MATMEVIHRFRVKPAFKSWGAKGPDLLRRKGNARGQLRKLVADLVDRPLFVKVGKSPWRKAGTVRQVMSKFDRRYSNADASTFKVGVKVAGVIVPKALVRREKVKVLLLANTSPDTIVAWSLMRHQFGRRVKFGGAYVYKETSPGYWSDHAWGTAVDGSAYAYNGKLTDWVARMARENQLDFDYALGSRRGRVVQVSGSGEISKSGASKSHLWHVHCSARDHDGRKPPRPGGVW
jgi:hypothetical protein